jgi:hypothetical protein
MGVLKTIAVLWVLALAAPPSAEALPQGGLPERAAERALLFAACAGRYAARQEHAWLMGGDGAEAEAGRGQFLDLLDAQHPAALAEGLSAPALLHARIAAKAAQARLLQLARFHTDAAQRRRAGAEARRAMAPCAALLLA